MSNSNYIRNLSIKNKVIAIILFVSILTMSVGFAFIGFWNMNRLKNEIHSGLILNSKLVASYCIAPLTFGDDQQATNLLSQLKNIDFIETAVLYNKEGDVFAKYLGKQSNSESISIQRIKESEYKDGYFYVYEAVIYQNKIYGTLCIKANSNALIVAKRKMITTLSILMVILILLSLILASMMQRYISKPILMLSNHFKKIAEDKDLTAYVAKQNDDEVGKLYDGFNTILNQINVRQEERDIAMSSLIESEERNQILLDFSPIGLALTQMDGSFVEANPSFIKILGMTTSEILKLNYQAISPEKYHKKDIETVEALIETGSYGPYEKEFIHKNGNLVSVSLSGIILERDGEKFIWSSIEDITERKKTDKEIQQLLKTSEKSGQVLLSVLEDERFAREEVKLLNKNLENRVIKRTLQLENANKEMEAFSYSVSHDLRAPLRHINGYIDMLKRQFPDSLPEKGVRYMDTIADSAQQMGSLIDDLLQFSRTGRQEMKKSNIDMNLIFEQVLTHVNIDSQNRDIKWIKHILPQVYCDSSLMKQVWINLLNNAVKFTSKKEKAIIEVGYKENEKDFVFCIADNGVGFDMKYAGKLFGVFQRLHSKTDYEGTGIGLANVQRIILRHGGRIWAEAETDKGANFYFTIPKEIKEPNG